MRKFSSKTIKWIITGLLCLCIFIVIVRYYNVSQISKQKSVSNIIDTLPLAFKKALISMYDSQDQMGSDGKMYKLDAATRILAEQGMCLYNLCRKIKPKRTLEIGFAYGYSTVFFLAAIKSNGIGYHVAMDPFEISDWHGIGLKKVEELKMDSFFRFMPEYDLFGI
ncbi:MAG: hypothetical protein PHD97_12590, partial [Bacteroidales bacterium]|nr:hypothetical protein [Bacteroidales bacterium]